MTFVSLDHISEAPIILLVVYISYLRHPLFDDLLNAATHVVHDEFRQRQSDVFNRQFYRSVKHSRVSIYEYDINGMKPHSIFCNEL